ncbi:MAG: MMPL family transporter [Pseudomonadota bacterium]
MEPSYFVAATVLALTLLAAIGAKNLDLTTDNRVFFGETNPQLKEFEAFETTFNELNSLMVVFHSKEETVFTAKTLEAVRSFTEAAWQLPYANRVESISNYSHSYARDDDIFVKDLVTEEDLANPQTLQEIREVAINDPLIFRRLVSEQENTTAVFINFIYQDTDEKTAIGDIIGSLNDTVANIEDAFPHLSVYKTGDIILGHTVEQATNDDVALLFPLMLLLIILLIGIVLKSVWVPVAVFIVMILSVVMALGFAGWLGYILNPGSAIAPTIIITIAIADSVHIVTNTMDGLRNKLSKVEAVKYSLRINIVPIALTTVTTAAGFLTLNFSDAPPFNDLGNIVAMGCVAAFVHSVLVLPWLLTKLPIKAPNTHIPPQGFERLGKWLINNRLIVSVIVVASISLSALGITQLVLTDRWSTYFDQRYEFRTDTDFIIENHSGIEAVEFNLPSAAPDQIGTVEYLQAVDRFSAWLRSQQQVDYVVSISDIIKRLNKNLHGDDPAYYRIPDGDDNAAQYLLLYELSLPFGSDLQDRIDALRASTRVTAVGDFTSSEHRELEVSAANWLVDNAPDYMHAEATGMSTLFAHISERNINTMLFGTLGLLICISILLTVVLRKVKHGLLSLVPNIFPPVAAVGLWGWVYGELGMAVAVVGAITLGIIVDDTIHMLTKYRAARQSGIDNTEDAIVHMFGVVGKPIFITTLALGLGFGVLAFSGFQVNWAMGILAAWTIVIALITDFVLIPALLLWSDR